MHVGWSSFWSLPLQAPGTHLTANAESLSPPPPPDHRRQSESGLRSFIFPVPMFVDYILTAKGGIDPALLSLSPPPQYIREKRSQLTPWLWIWKCILLMLKWHCNFCSDFLQETYSTHMSELKSTHSDCTGDFRALHHVCGFRWKSHCKKKLLAAEI